MSLPADPKNMVYGIYNGQGQDITRPPTPEDEYRHWLFTAGNESSGMYSDNYGIEDYTSY